MKQTFLDVLEENYEAAKRLTKEDKARPAQELLLETYEDLISIYKANFIDWVIKDDNICPATQEQCDDECCPVGAVCNLKSSVLGNDIQPAPSAQ